MFDNMYTIQNVINYINSIKQQKNSSKGICVLLGAGADITSGGKTFRSLKIDFLRANNLDVSNDIQEENLTKKFDKLVCNFTQDGRCSELENVMRKNCQPSEGYELLVLLAHLGYIDAVITTNFDVLLEETEKQMSIKPFDIFTPGRAIPGDFYEKRQKCNPIFVKLHGDLYGRLVTHLTKEEIESKPYGSEFIKMVTYIIRNYAIITIGYGGYDNLLTDIFKENIEDLPPLYWCNITKPKTDAQLVQILSQHNKLCFVQSTFDNFFQKLGLYFLEKQELKDTNPYFLPTVIKAKILNQQVLYNVGFENTGLIERKEIDNRILDFLTNVDKNTVMLTGNAGMGKTSVIRRFIESYKDFSIVPIWIEKTEPEGILKCIANALGYKTDVPFSLLYNFANWCNQNHFNIIFVVDEIQLNSNEDDFVKYVKEMFDFFNVISNCNYIKVILSIDTIDYNKLAEKLESSAYESYMEAPIYVDKFTDEEMKKLLRDKLENLDQESYELIREPYMWALVSNSNINISNSLVDYIGEYIEATILKNNSIGLNSTMLQIILEKIAEASVLLKMPNVNPKNVEYLQNCKIVDRDGHFIYDKYTEYYYYKYIMRKGDTAEYIFESLCSEKYLQQKPVLYACSKALSDINSISELEHNLKVMANSLTQDDTRNHYAVILVVDSIKRIQQQKYNYLLDYLMDIELTKSQIHSIFDILCFTAIYASEDPYKLLNLMGSFPELAYNAFIVKVDYSNTILDDAIRQNDLLLFTDFIKKRYGDQQPETNFIEFIYMLSTWGPDNMSVKHFEELTTFFKQLRYDQLKNYSNEAVYKMAASKIKQYSYNILFNSGSNVEEKFSETIHNEELRNLYGKISNGAVLSLDEYLCLIDIATDINNVWNFLICNFVVVLSMQNDFSDTYIILQKAIDLLESGDIVKRLDFYLSSTFMSLYICQEKVFDHFNDIFSKIVDRYEVQLFNMPETRISTLQKFTDEFEMNFEDGFNPLAFYFYVAPSLCFLQKKPWDDGEFYLKHYWRLLHKLEVSGHYSEMLRIVHVLGQMISIYPDKGYAALEKMAKYPHDIIKKGVLRILKENYLRYPLQTNHFIQNTHFCFSKEELLDIQSNRDPKWCNRTLEQLHWCRIFVNLSNILNKNVTAIFMKQIYETDSYWSFMKSFLSHLF